MLNRLEALTVKRPVFIEADVRDVVQLSRVFAQHPISAVLHFAGLKSVSESVEKPNGVKFLPLFIYTALLAGEIVDDVLAILLLPATYLLATFAELINLTVVLR